MTVSGLTLSAVMVPPGGPWWNTHDGWSFLLIPNDRSATTSCSRTLHDPGSWSSLEQAGERSDEEGGSVSSPSLARELVERLLEPRGGLAGWLREHEGESTRVKARLLSSELNVTISHQTMMRWERDHVSC